MKRRTLLTAGAFVAAVSLTGCTAMLFENGRYEGIVDRFIVSEDGKKFVVLGKQYHDIFDMPEHLGAVPASSCRKSIRAALDGFVAQGSKIAGECRLVLSRTGVTDDDWARAGGRRCNVPPGRIEHGRCADRFELSGRRLRAGQDVIVVCPSRQDFGRRPPHEGRQGRSRARDVRHADGPRLTA